MDSDKINKLQELIDTSKKITIFTGAGASTESGIADFRSPKTGLWEHVNPEEVISIGSFKRNPELFYKFSVDAFLPMFNAKPNAIHELCTKLEQKDKLLGVITQNIDMLHQDAGTKKVYPVHGTMKTSTCIRCGKRFDNTLEIIEKFRDGDDKAYLCPQCNVGFIKPDIVFFGEMLPEYELDKAEFASYNCDLFISFGSSLTVMPAAMMPTLAKRNGAKLVIINLTPTSSDDIADLVIHEKGGEVVSKLNI